LFSRSNPFKSFSYLLCAEKAVFGLDQSPTGFLYKLYFFEDLYIIVYSYLFIKFSYFTKREFLNNVKHNVSLALISLLKSNIKFPAIKGVKSMHLRTLLRISKLQKGGEHKSFEGHILV
jgi:hypothetical protein